MMYHTKSLLGNNTPSGQEIQAFRNGRGQVVGRLEDGWLVKRGLNRGRHHLHRYGAWASEQSHIEHLKAIGAKGVRLCLDDRTVLEAPLAMWECHGFLIRHDGEQIALPDRFWTVHPPGARQLALALEVAQ